MTSVNKIGAEEIINENPVTAQNDQNLASIKNTMEEKDIRAIPVVDSKNQLEGVIGYRDLIRFVRFNPENTSLGKVMHQPPEFDESDSLVEVADLRINTGRKLLVQLENGKLKGVIGDQEFLEIFQEVEELGNITTQEIETKELETVFEEDTIEEARHKMLDSNISRLPVLDKNGKLTGMLKSTDILQTMVSREAPRSGGTSGGRSGNEVFIAGGGEKEKMSNIAVEELMNRNPLTFSERLDGDIAAEKMLRNDTAEMISVDGEYPEAIVTAKDLIGHVSDYAPANTVLVNITGLELPEEKAAVHEMAKKQLQGSLGRKLEKPEELSIVIKKADKDGKKHRWEVDMKLFSEYGLTTVQEEDWQLRDVIGSALDDLNEIIRRKKEEKTDHH